MSNVATTAATRANAIEEVRAMLELSRQQLATFRSTANDDGSVVVCAVDAACMTITFAEGVYKFNATNSPTVWHPIGARNLAALWNKRNEKNPVHLLTVADWCAARRSEIEAASADVEAAASCVA